MHMKDIFNFELKKITKRLELVRTELRANSTWDLLFYQGDFDTENLDDVRCIAQCHQCFKSWFNIGFRDFESNRLSDLVRDGLLSAEDISNYQLAEVFSMGDSVFYRTKLEAGANYVAVKCTRCNTHHFLVLGITETQPTRYAGALNGMWLMRE